MKRLFVYIPGIRGKEKRGKGKKKEEREGKRIALPFLQSVKLTLSGEGEKKINFLSVCCRGGGGQKKGKKAVHDPF